MSAHNEPHSAAAKERQDAESVAEILVFEVPGWKAYCAACHWYSVEYGDHRGARRSGEHHMRERHSDGSECGQ